MQDNVRYLTEGEVNTLVSIRQQPEALEPAASRTIQCGQHTEDAHPHRVGNDLCVGRWTPPTHYIDPAKATVFVAYGSRGTKVPLVTLRCCFCRELVDIVFDETVADATFGITRVNGDSKYGYEPYHLACCQ